MASDKIIIYDDSCPLCCWYTDAFVSTGLLKKENRLSFGQLPNEGLLEKLDLEKSKDEIPLLDSAGGPTLYGIDSLLEILGRRWLWMRKAASFSPVYWFLRRLYKLVSYNRRVIVAADPGLKTGFDCTPHFNLFYRTFYIVLATLIGGGSIIAYTVVHTLPAFGWTSGVIAIFLGIAGNSKSLEKRIEYWGVMVTPFLLMGLLLFPAIFLPGLKFILALPAVFIGVRMVLRRWKFVQL